MTSAARKADVQEYAHPSRAVHITTQTDSGSSDPPDVTLSTAITKTRKHTMPKSPRKTKPSTDVNAERANAIAAKVADQVKTIIGRNWPEISKILADAENGNEIKLGFNVNITDRPATPGEHSDKDNRILTSMSFSQKTSDKIESAIPDPSQPELPENPAEEPATE